MKYFIMSGSEDQRLGVAYYETIPHKYLSVTGKGFIPDWKPIKLVLRDGIYSDLQNNNCDFILCSPKLKNILVATKANVDELQWLAVELVLGGGEEKKEYYALHFPAHYDVLNKNKTKSYDNSIFTPVLDKEKVSGHSIFTYTGGNDLQIIVEDCVRKVILKEKCSGIEFEKISAE